MIGCKGDWLDTSQIMLLFVNIREINQ